MREKFLYVLLMVVLGLMTQSCHPERKQLSDSVAKLKSECPINCDALGSLTKIIYYKGTNKLDMEWSCDPFYYSSDLLKDNPDNQKELFRMIAQQPQFRTILRTAANAGTEVSVDYVCSNQSATTQKLSADEVQTILDMPRLTESDINYILLRNHAAIKTHYLAAHPEEYENGSRSKGALMTDDAFIYVIELDDKTARVAQIRNIKNIKDIVKHTFKELYTNDYVVKQNVKMLEPLGCGVKFRYVDSNGRDSIDVVITPQEVHNISML